MLEMASSSSSSSLITTLTSNVKRQPFSPTSCNPFSTDFYNPHHQQMTLTYENEPLSSISNTINGNSSKSNFVSPLATPGTIEQQDRGG